MEKLSSMKENFLKRIEDINPNYDLELIGRAFEIAYTSHVGQLRRSGDPYIVHPLEVAVILADLGMDEETIIAGIMHDVVEDTDYSEEDLERDFGPNITHLVNGVTKLGSLVFDTKEERQAENMRRMFLAMSKDIRVLIIKLADRLHNLRTINYLNAEKIKEKCKETLDIYAPLASRLGMYSLKFELEDIGLKQLEPEIYAEISQEIEAKRNERQENLDAIVIEMKEALENYQIQYEISGRSKHFYSIYKKKKFQGKNIDEIFDLLGVRVIVDSIKDCYSVLGIVHTNWTPIPGRFKDYIAMPKQNMYQSLHTTVIGSNGKPFEIQIRTYEMNRIAEYGIAAHWKYKEGVSLDKEEAKFAWLRQSLEWQKEMDDPNEFMEALKVDLFENQVFVFTPKGHVMELPAGATPLDFAFKVHTDVGVKCVGAKINGKMVPIDHTLKNGDIIEIVTNSNSGGPSIDWLKIAKSSGARSKIRQYLKKENKSDNIARGKDAIDKFLRKKGLDPKEILKGNYLHKVIKEQGFSSTDELYLNLGATKPFVSKIGNSLIKIYLEDQKIIEEKEDNIITSSTEDKTHNSNRQWKNDHGVVVPGMENLLIRVSKCCSPVPGDEIIGFITKGRGIAVHRIDCENLKSLPMEEKKRMIEVEWEKNEGSSYNVNINIVGDDRKGLFGEISKACESSDISIEGVVAKKNKKNATVNITLTLAIENIDEVGKIMRIIKGIPGILDVFRAKS